MVKRRRDMPMFYAPQRPPSSQEELGGYVYRELSGVAQALMACRALVIPLYRAAPAKPVEGQLARADGETWDPGAGAGCYCYYNGQWRCLVVEPGGQADRVNTDKDEAIMENLDHKECEDGEDNDGNRTVE